MHVRDAGAGRPPPRDVERGAEVGGVHVRLPQGVGVAAGRAVLVAGARPAHDHHRPADGREVAPQRVRDLARRVVGGGRRTVQHEHELELVGGGARGVAGAVGGVLGRARDEGAAGARAAQVDVQRHGRHGARPLRHRARERRPRAARGDLAVRDAQRLQHEHQPAGARVEDPRVAQGRQRPGAVQGRLPGAPPRGVEHLLPVTTARARADGAGRGGHRTGRVRRGLRRREDRARCRAGDGAVGGARRRAQARGERLAPGGGGREPAQPLAQDDARVAPRPQQRAAREQAQQPRAVGPLVLAPHRVGSLAEGEVHVGARVPVRDREDVRAVERLSGSPESVDGERHPRAHHLGLEQLAGGHVVRHVTSISRVHQQAGRAPR